MNKFGRIILRLLTAVSGVIVSLFIIAFACEYRPQQEETVIINPAVSPIKTNNDTITILAWNIGYCGLEAQMDFFMDGGQGVRTTKEATEQNLHYITKIIKQIDADIVLLQEVDRNSTRSYNIDQMEYIQKSMPEYYSCFATNYKSLMVPAPLSNPTGKVHAGLLTLSKIKPISATRHRYPQNTALIQRPFMLKRALLTCVIPICSDTLIVGNTHNSAYGDTEIRTSEMEIIQNVLNRSHNTAKAIIGGDWNQMPPQYTPSQEALNDPYYHPTPVVQIEGYNWIADLSTPSMRYTDRPYKIMAAHKTAITDMFLIEDGLQILSAKTINLDFAHSDHNPVVITLKLNP